MPDGGTLTIKAENTHLDEAWSAEKSFDVKPGNYVMVAVRDTGTGMTAEVMEKAFDPFFSTKGMAEGTGLGLSMVYGFVVRHAGGHVDIVSEEGSGTTVRLYFPAIEAGEEQLSSKPAKTEAPHQHGQGTVLVVEDNADVLEATVAMIEGLGYTVHMAKDASEAFAVVDDVGNMDVLLTDVILPAGIHGDDLASTILADYPETKVIFMSGYPEDELAARGITIAGNTLLRKPFKLDKLKQAFEETMAGGCEPDTIIS